MNQVTDTEKFLFDIQGYLILPGAIDGDLIDALDCALVRNTASVSTASCPQSNAINPPPLKSACSTRIQEIMAARAIQAAGANAPTTSAASTMEHAVVTVWTSKATAKSRPWCIALAVS